MRTFLLAANFVALLLMTYWIREKWGIFTREPVAIAGVLAVLALVSLNLAYVRATQAGPSSLVARSKRLRAAWAATKPEAHT